MLNKGKKNIESILSQVVQENIEIGINFRNDNNSRLSILNADTRQLIIPSLDNLSAGQSTLLSIFATIIRYSDRYDINKSINLRDIQGIVLIDEIDLHLHIELQKEVLPKLIKLFPKVQFIVSSHSPFFLYGMQQEFNDSVLFVNVPSGNILKNVGDFEEFEKAYTVFQDLTYDYKNELDRLRVEVSQSKKPILFCEGVTDEAYLKKAIKVLNFDLDVDIRWIGKKQKGQSQFGGVKALDHTYDFFTSNEDFVKNKIILLYDCDEKKDNLSDEKFNVNEGDVYKRRIPCCVKNPIKKGIENLLSQDTIDKIRGHEKSLIRKRMREDEGSGAEVVYFEVANNKKTIVQEWICGNGTKEDFENFKGVLNMIKEIIDEDKKEGA